MDRSPVYGRAVQFRVLGPLEADAGEGPIPLGGRKQRAVLASLLVRANEVVSADALIEGVWGEDAPDTARNILQTYVANLRKALGDDRLQGRSPGYVLSVGPAELDAARFDDLVARAKTALPVDPSVAIATFDDALALWRGPALADLHEHSSLLAEAARLDELRLDAQEQRVEGLLATGANAKALAELEPLLDGQPLRESLWGLAMLASYREGRQADALNAYGRARELLADELGIDPSPELARLHERILKQDPGLELRGEPLRGYRLLERLGTGSLGAVFRGIQPHVGRDVAVKVVDERIAADPEFVARFEHDAQIAAALEHPHIVPMYDYWREPGRAYLVHRYMRGGSLRALRERGAPLDRQRALTAIAQVAAALGFAHRQGVVHGGVRDSNVLLDPEGNAYLTDFRIGAGAVPDPSEDLRALERLSRDLLAGDVPGSIAEVLGDPTVGAIVEPNADAVADAANALLEPRAVRFVRTREERNPYKGLRAFAESDAQDFFGRAELTIRLVEALNDSHPAARFLALVGPSGGGKSSAVRAGLVPALRAGALASSRPVVVADMFPGLHPMDELEAALVRVSARSHSRLGDLLRSGSRGLLDAVDLVAPEGADLVLVVDQFEELFTLAADEREREHLLDALRVCALDPHSRLVVIATLRADFYDRPLVYPRFGELLAERNVTVPPLTADELEQAIRRPAERQGMRLEPGLVAEMIADVAHQPGGLPLLQYALTELFERRDGDRLMLSAYRDIGGVTGALSARADRLYADTDVDGRSGIQQVFLRLVTLGEGRQDTRRRVAIEELDGLDVTEAALSKALDSYGRHRLLTFDREPATREPTVEIAHESLLRSWGRLASWIDDAREDLRQNERLVRAAAEWRGSERDPSFLMSGVRLDQVETWAGTTSLSVGQPERAYIKASVGQRDRERDAERVRAEHEAQIERRSVRRLRGLVAVFAVAALVAGSLTIVATNQGGRAEREARAARAREFAAAAVANLEEDPERSVLLAIEAVTVTRSVDGSVSPEALDALHRAIAASRIERTVFGLGPPVGISPAGVFAAQASDEAGAIDIVSMTTGDRLLRFRAHEGKVRDLTFSVDGELLATAGSDGTLKVWDPSSGDLVSAVTGQGRVSGVSFDREGTLVSASWQDEQRIRVVDARTGHITVTLPFASGDTALSPSGTSIAFVDTPHDNEARVIDLATGEERFDPLSSSSKSETIYGFSALSWSPDGRALATVSSSALDVWDAITGELRVTSFEGASPFVEWSSDSSRLVTADTVWEVGDRSVERVFTLNSLATRVGVADVAVSPDGDTVMRTTRNGSAVSIWDAGIQGDAEWANLPAAYYYGDVAFLPGGRLLAVDAENRLTVWDPASGLPVRTFGPDVREHRLHMSADGRSIAISEYTAGLSAWDVPSGERLFGRRNAGPLEGLYAGWSPDGRLLAMSRYVDGNGTVSGTPGTTIVDRQGQEIGSLGSGQDAWGTRYSPDGRLLAVVSADKDGRSWLKLWDWRHREALAEFPSGTDTPVAFDADGERIVFQGNDGVPEVWDVESGERVSQLRGGTPPTCSLAFSPDGSLVAVGGDDGAVRVYDSQTGGSVLVLRGPPRAVCGVAFSPDGRMLASHRLGVVHIWAMDVDDLLRIAGENVTRELTDEECRQYLHADTCSAA